MKIWKLEQLKQQTNVDEMVLAKAEEILKVLNVHYGDDRLVTDLGGYILLDIEGMDLGQYFGHKKVKFLSNLSCKLLTFFWC